MTGGRSVRAKLRAYEARVRAPRRRRFAVVVVVLVVLAVAAWVWASPAADAAGASVTLPTGTDCLRPPTPASPVNAIDPGPAAPREGDPFAPGAQVTIYEVYGYAGLASVAYDPGCNPVAGVISWTPFANALGTFSVSIVAVAARSWRAATDGTMATVIEPLQSALVGITGWGLFVPLLAVAILATGLWLLFWVRRTSLADSGRYVGTMLLVLVCAVAAMFYPLVVGPAVDKGVNAAIAAVNGAVSGGTGLANTGDAIAAAVHEEVLYQTWLVQTFGPENKAAADEFGSRLFSQAAFTRTEQRGIDADPAKAAGLIDMKKNNYKAVAKEVETKYPAAYQYLAGNNSTNTLSASLLALFCVVISVMFLLYALWKVVYSLVKVRVVIGAAPAVAIIAQHPLGQPLFWRILSSTWASIVAGVIAAAGAVVFLVVFIGGVLRSDLPMVVKIFVLLVLTFVMAHLMRLSTKRVKDQSKRFADERKRSNAPTNAPGAPAAPSTGGSAGGAAAAGSAAAGSAAGAAAGAVYGSSWTSAGAAGGSGSGTSVVAGAVTGAARAAVGSAAMGAVTGGTVSAGAVAAGALGGATSAHRANGSEPLDASPGAAGAVGAAPASAPADAPVHRPASAATEGQRLYRTTERAPAALGMTPAQGPRPWPSSRPEVYDPEPITPTRVYSSQERDRTPDDLPPAYAATATRNDGAPVRVHNVYRSPTTAAASAQSGSE